jgi:RNA polymerase sigma-70 factor (ECF subfamily)
MPPTSASLLDRLRVKPDPESWRQLVELYTPLIRTWLHRHAALLADADADDLVQEVLTVVVRRLPTFEYRRRTGAFRRWLRTITVNCLRDFWRSRRKGPQATGDSEFLHMLEQLEDPQSTLSKVWDQEHDRHVTQALLERIRPRFNANTWTAFRRVALDGASAEAVAEELGLTVNAVFIAKSRVLSLLRQEGADLLR